MPKKPALLPLESLNEAAECLRVLAHPVRLRIVELLLQGGYTVGQISELCELAPHQTSEHLRLMQGRGLLDGERRGRAVYYRVINPTLPAIMACIRSSCHRSS